MNTKVKSYSIIALPTIPILLSLIFSILEIQNLLTYTIGLFSVCFIPGFLLLKRLRIQLGFYELIPTSIVFNMVILVLLGIYLSITPPHISSISALSSILFFTIILQLFLFLRKQVDSEMIGGYWDNFLRKINEIRTPLILLIIVGLIPVLLLDDVLRYKYFLGFDPFRNEPVTLSIIQNNLNLVSLLYQKGIVFSGFYYFSSILHVSTGISLYNFTRFGGLVFLSLLSMMMFVILYKIFNDKWAAIIPFFYMINPFVVNRFLMTLRENFSFLFLMLLIFFLIRLNESTEKKHIIFVSSMVFGAILSTHPLTTIYASIILFSFILTKHDLKTYIPLMLGGCLFIFPMLGIFASWLDWAIRAQIHIFLGYSKIPSPSWLSEQRILLGWGRDISIKDFSILEIALLPLGIFYAVRKEYVSRKKPLFFIIPLCLLSLILYLFAKLGFHFTPVRLVIYLALPLSILSVLGLRETIIDLCNYIPSIIIKPQNIVLKRNILKIFFHSVIIIPIIFFNSIDTINLNKWSPYLSSQVEGAIWLKQQVGNESDTIVIPSYSPGLADMGLIEYVGIKNAIYWDNLTLVENIMAVKKYNDLMELIHSNYPNKQKAYFFISKRWVGHYRTLYNFTLLDILNQYAECLYQKEVLIFKIQIHALERIHIERYPPSGAHVVGFDIYKDPTKAESFCIDLNGTINHPSLESLKEYIDSLIPEGLALVYKDINIYYYHQRQGLNHFYEAKAGNHTRRFDNWRLNDCLAWIDKQLDPEPPRARSES